MRPASAEGANPAFSPDDRRLVDAGWDGVIRLVDAATGAVVLERAYRDCMVTAVAHAPGTDHFAFAVNPKKAPGVAPPFDSGAIVEWRYPFDRTAPSERTTGLWSIAALCLAPASGRIAVAGWEPPRSSQLLLLEPGSGETIQRVPLDNGRVSALAWLPGDRYIGVVDSDRVVVLDGDGLQQLAQVRCRYACSIAFDPDGEHALIGSWEAGYRIPLADLWTTTSLP